MVKLIYKTRNKLHPNNYRPIRLTSLMVKVMESIVSDAIRDHLGNHSTLAVGQHGFVPEKSVTTNLVCALNAWTAN